MLLNARWQFGNILLLSNNERDLVAFIGLEGVNIVFSQFALILIATFFF
jgi:hypothetical protein